MTDGQRQAPPAESGGASLDVTKRLVERLDAALEKLAEAKPFAKSPYQTDMFQIAETLMGSDAGMRALSARAHLFDEAGVFTGGPWAQPSRLQPPLVAGSLRGTGVYPVVEILSELRMLAIAQSRTEAEEEARTHAREFLDEVLALNLEYIFPRDTEEERLTGGPHRGTAIRLFALLAEELDLSSLRQDVIAEIDQICAQRPIMTHRVRQMIAMAERIPDDETADEANQRLEIYKSAVSGPSGLSREFSDPADYREALKRQDESVLEVEAADLANSMDSTGLCCEHHAVLLRHLRAKHPDLIPAALALNEAGAAELQQNEEFVLLLIRVAVFPSTAQCIYGLKKVLERSALSRQEISGGLRRIIDLDFQTEVRRNLLARRTTRDGVTANSLLLAGAIAVLGQPLGVGQGDNPTCQAARALSLWAQHAPGYLLETVVSAARDGVVQMDFDGERIRSNELIGGLAARMDFNLDPVSIVLVSHLDRLYDAMMKRVVLRAEDGHKWVNPALYGRWVANGFASVFSDRAQTTIAGYDDFVRRFYATHHPAYNEGHTLMYPNPVGILVTNGHGDYLGPHAVSIQRIIDDPKGVLRVYFFNPNNEGRQDWGEGVKPAVRGNGEEEGESSLPFGQFVSRLYAFHYNPYEEGDAYAVPKKVIDEIEEASRSTWGRAFRWVSGVA